MSWPLLEACPELPVQKHTICQPAGRLQHSDLREKQRPFLAQKDEEHTVQCISRCSPRSKAAKTSPSPLGTTALQISSMRWAASSTEGIAELRSTRQIMIRAAFPATRHIVPTHSAHLLKKRLQSIGPLGWQGRGTFHEFASAWPWKVRPQAPEAYLKPCVPT